MPRFTLLLTTLALWGAAQTAMAASSPELVEFQTNLGTIAIKPDYVKAPISADNFMTYVDNGFYANTLIHRVIKGFVLQGGGFDKNTGKLKTTLPPIANESTNGLSNQQWTVAMARTNDPNSATSQFFINLVDNLFLNYSSATSPGYAVFATVTRGKEVAQQIENLASYNELPFSSASNLVYIEAVYKNDVVQPTVAKTRIRLSGSGRVVSDPIGIDCGSTCTSSMTIGGSIKLKATPAKGYIFTGWSGDCKGPRPMIYVNTQHGNHNCTAVFTPNASLTQ